MSKLKINKKMTNTVKIIPEGVEKLKQLESDLNNSKKITIKMVLILL